MNKTYHISVLPNEVIEYLAPKPHGLYVDATFGGGGHTRLILEAEPTCTVLGFDWDTNALDTNAPPLELEFGDRFVPILGSFAHLSKILKKRGYDKVDGILADFGTSQFQIKELPGFSFNISTPLDMRMSPGHYKTTAYDVVNKATEKELAEILFTYGEERASRKIAKLIVQERQKKPIRTTIELANIVKKIVKPFSRSVHPATKTFQAIRIFVNDELKNIKALLTQSLTVLNPEGRIVCISFHSLEDRIVKQFFRDHKEQLTILTKRIVIATDEEVQANPSSRSAKLRAAQIK